MVIREESHLEGIAQLIVHENLLDKLKALEYQRVAQKNKQSLLQYLVSNQILDSAKTALIIAQRFGVPFLDLNCIDPDTILSSIISETLIRRHNLVPLYTRGNYLFLATDDPSQQHSLKEIQFHTRLQTSAIVVESDKLQAFIANFFQEKESQGLIQSMSNSAIELDGLEINMEDNEDAPIVKFVNNILSEAIRKGVSDIHFEPYEHEYRIRYRLDGLLSEIAAPPVNLASRITSRIKVMSRLDISERRIPQDGRFKLKFSNTRTIDFRVSTCPTVGGEKVAIRILDPDSTKLGIETLGFNHIQRNLFLKAITRPQGMVLVTGPTGSGKSLTLYTALTILNTNSVNISTAEDPVEINIPGINQVNINPKSGLSFSNVLRAFLRQDPDIIMVGEVRDLETAEIALKAAQTGHLVLSTLHTNSAAETLTRMLNMGIPSFNIVSSVNLLVAQRLVRKLCNHCKVIRDDISPQHLQELGISMQKLDTVKTYKAVGCKRCSNGFQGRIGLFEVLPMSKEIGKLIMSGANSLDMLAQAQKEGMVTMYESGVEKIKDGITTIEEVNRVTIE